MNVADHLKHLEETLLSNDVRKNAAHISSLLTEDFREFGSSGRSFSKAEIIASLQAEPPIGCSLKQFEASLLAKDIALVTYRSVSDIPGSHASESLRSSVWVLREARWQMLFHQGTPIPAPVVAPQEGPR